MADGSERLARLLAQTITGCDPDAPTLTEGYQFAKLAGGITILPEYSVPLWTHFYRAAETLLASGQVILPNA